MTLEERALHILREVTLSVRQMEELVWQGARVSVDRELFSEVSALGESVRNALSSEARLYCEEKEFVAEKHQLPDGWSHRFDSPVAQFG